MSVLRPLLSRRGRLALLAISLLLITALVAAPSVSGAKAAVKQFTAKIVPPNTTYTGGVPGTWTLEVKNCGTPIAAPCTASSTIGLGQVRITVPEAFRPGFTFGVVTASPPRNWTVSSYDSSTGSLVARAVTGSDKLASGEFVDIPFSATPTGCSTASGVFTTAGWGSLPTTPDSEPFSIVGSQPSVTGLGCTFTGPNGQTETITGDFQGDVNVTFGGETGPDCSSDADFGALGDQWQVYQLPTQVTITPASNFVAGDDPKISTSEFPLPASGGDSSWFLICFAVPQTGHTAFETRGGGTAIPQTIGGIPHFVGILASCNDAPTPCVSEQFLTTGPGAPPWSPGANKVHISVRMDPGDPYKR